MAKHPDKYITRKCKNCGIEYLVLKSSIIDRKTKCENPNYKIFCSNKCRSEYIYMQTHKPYACDNCGKVFIRYTKRRNSKKSFCSPECKTKFQVGINAPRWKYGKIVRTCKNCGKEFKTSMSKIQNGEGNFCSRRCTSTYYGKYKREFVTKPNTTCRYCGKEIYIEPARLGNKIGNFCSKDHHIAWQRSGGEYKNHLQTHYAKKYPRKKYNCIICGTEFDVKPYLEKMGRTKYCSHKCYWSDMTNLMSGDKHPNWRGGISKEPYCEKWNEDLRERVRAFFNRKCILCGTLESQLTRKLRVHHVYYNKQACCDDTPRIFAPLCGSCHAKTNHNREYYMKEIGDFINTHYNGKSYFTKEEYAAVENGK